MDWELIRQQKQAQIYTFNIRENNKKDYHDCKVGDRVILNNSTAYKYKTAYKGTFVITHFCPNSTIKLQCCVIRIINNISRLKLYTSDTNVEDNNPENMYEHVNI